MPELVALDLPAGATWLAELRRAWDDGDAVFPVDPRLPPAARRTLLSAIAPTVVVDSDGRRRIDGRPVADGDALVVATSGTTGTPKGVVHTMAGLRAAAAAVHARLALRADDTWLACLPLAHVGGFGVVARAVLDDVPVVVQPRVDAELVRRAAHDGATLVSLVPTALARIDPSWFRVVVLGGARPPAERPANVLATYGLTETGGGVVYDGRPLDGVEVRIGATGTVHVRGPMLMRGYRDAESPDGVTEPFEDGWFDTGDVGRLLPDGRLQVDGRRGEMIITGGENVWPEVVEAALADHPAVADVAVLGIPDPTWGERIVALVVGRHGETPDTATLAAHLGERLPRFMAPKEIRLVAAIPRTSLGKIVRADLPALADGDG